MRAARRRSRLGAGAVPRHGPVGGRPGLARPPAPAPPAWGLHSIGCVPAGHRRRGPPRKPCARPAAALGSHAGSTRCRRVAGTDRAVPSRRGSGRAVARRPGRGTACHGRRRPREGGTCRPPSAPWAAARAPPSPLPHARGAGPVSRWESRHRAGVRCRLRCSRAHSPSVCSARRGKVTGSGAAQGKRSQLGVDGGRLARSAST